MVHFEKLEFIMGIGQLHGGGEAQGNVGALDLTDTGNLFWI